MMKKILLSLTAIILFLSCSNTINEHIESSILTITQSKGLTLTTHVDSRVNILYQDGYAFKDMNRNGSLDIYEDWRLSAQERAADLAAKLPIEYLGGIMLHTTGLKVPDALDTTSKVHSNICSYVNERNIRYCLVTKSPQPGMTAQFNNWLQKMAESNPFAIPVVISSDPRNEVKAYEEFNEASGGKCSHWPIQLALGATFDMDVVRDYADVISQEFRAQGITMFLGPQADLATEPRWRRVPGTFSEDIDLVTDMTRVCTDVFQTTAETESGWGNQSVACMVKHWPCGGNGEAGRDAHISIGKYAVFPGNCLQGGMHPFLEGAFKLDGKTSKASSVMAYYTISHDIDPSGENVANAYSKYIITDLLKNKYAYEGYVSTDWQIISDYVGGPSDFSGKCWGVEHLTYDQRYFKLIESGIDQVSGVMDHEGMMRAYASYAEKYGEDLARVRFQSSAEKILLVIFRLGLFESAYVDVDEADRLVGCEEFCKRGHDAMRKSIVMLKNRNSALPMQKGSKVYVPKTWVPGVYSMVGWVRKEGRFDYSVDTSLVAAHYTIVEDPKDADFALVGLQEPITGIGYDKADRNAGGNGYVPITLQYSDYTAEVARERSIAGGDPFDRDNDRSYKGKTVSIENKSSATLVSETRELMGDKPIVVLLQTSRPVVSREFEPDADAILVGFNISPKCFFDITIGEFEPYGLLPIQFPANMETVELQYEDVPRDMIPHVDSEGHAYDFAYGLDWNGIINDTRVQKYK